MRINQHRVFNVLDMSIDHQRKTIAVEMSELGIAPGVDPFVPLYDDACDIGLYLINPKSGATTAWALDTPDGSGGARLVPTPESLWKAPKLRGWVLMLFND